MPANSSEEISTFPNKEGAKQHHPKEGGESSTTPKEEAGKAALPARREWKSGNTQQEQGRPLYITWPCFTLL